MAAGCGNTTRWRTPNTPAQVNSDRRETARPVGRADLVACRPSTRSATGSIVATGENTSHPATDTSDAVIALDLETGKVAWNFQAMAADVWNMACDDRDLKRTGRTAPTSMIRGPRPRLRLRRDADDREGRAAATWCWPARSPATPGAWTRHRQGAVEPARGRRRSPRRRPLGHDHGRAIGLCPDQRPDHAGPTTSRRVNKAGIYAYRIRDGKQVGPTGAADCAGGAGRQGRRAARRSTAIPPRRSWSTARSSPARWTARCWCWTARRQGAEGGRHGRPDDDE